MFYFKSKNDEPDIIITNTQFILTKNQHRRICFQLPTDQDEYDFKSRQALVYNTFYAFCLRVSKEYKNIH